MNPLRIGTRASALARWQAENVRAQLAAIGSPAELVFIRTTGDRDSESSLRNIGGKGVFTKEIEDALLDGRADLAVHSMKDVPTELPAGLLLAAICKRADVRDALVSRSLLGLDDLPQGARVGTTSLRRQAQLRLRRPDLVMVELRGNVDTRLAKVARGDCEAIVLAKAGLDRLEMADRITEVLSTDICLPAAGQGAVGIEARADDGELLRTLRKLNHIDTQIAVEAERLVLAGLQGGCQVPVGIWARGEGRKFLIEACVLAADGSESIRVRRMGLPRDADDLAREITAALLNGGAERLLRPVGRALTPAEGKRLAGRRIVVTRAAEQSEELLALLRDAGAEASSLPMVRFVDPVDTAELDRAIGALADFDWLILTSANAVQFFLARCRQLGRWPGAEKPKIAAVGPATGNVIESEGLRVSFMPQAFNGAALAAELAPQLCNQHVLLPRSDRADAKLPAALRAAGADVMEVVAYRTVAPESQDASLLQKICQGEVDAVIFFSPSAVREFVRIVGAEAFQQIGQRGTLAVVGSVTAHAIREAGAHAAVEAPKATAGSLVEALERHFAPQPAVKGRS